MSSRGPRQQVPQVVHELPCRLRVRAPHLFRRPDVDSVALAGLIEALPGVTSARVNPRACSVVVTYDGKTRVRRSVLRRLATLAWADLPRAAASDGDGHLIRLAAIGLAAAAGPLLPPVVRSAVGWLTLAPALAAGATTLARRGVRVEVLDAVALGASAAKGDMTTALITYFLLNLGEHLEASTRRSSDDLLRQLLKPQPQRVWIEHGRELVEVGLDVVKRGDIVVVGPGEMIAVDGQVVSGAAQVNEAAISGEFVPAAREAGDRVLSGSVVEEGRLRIRAVAVGDDTTTARITRFLKESLNQRSAIQETTDRFADARVKLTLGLGGVIWLLTRDITRMASVFLVDYSCALKLGTPVAIKATMYQGAHRGILIKGGHALERLAECDTVVFDKTGTLTHGQLDVTDIVALARESWPERRLLALIASIEEHSIHPVADAVVSAARERRLGHVSHEEVEFIVAHGLISEVDGHRVVIGSRHFLEEHEGVACAGQADTVERLEAEGKNLLFVGLAGQLIGIVALRDRLRDEAATTLTALRRLGIGRLVIITGDRRAKALALGKALGVDEVFAEQPPEAKADIVTELQARGRKVAFVGDGVNDAPALIAADVGIAMPHGADLARATADIVLVEDRLDAVAEARDLAMRGMALIRSNFRIAVGVNSLLFLAASLGLSRPLLTAFLHNGTTIGVLLRGLAGVGKALPARQAVAAPREAAAEIAVEEEAPANVRYLRAH